MIRIVRLKKFALGRYEDLSSFPLGDLTIQLEGLPNYANAEVRFIGKINENEIIRISVTDKNNILTINQELLDCGEFKAAVIIYVKGIKIEEYQIEPLTVTAVEGRYFADPVIAELQKNLITSNTAIKVLQKENAELKNSIKVLTGRVVALTDFAKACIASSPYISDLKIQEEGNK